MPKISAENFHCLIEKSSIYLKGPEEVIERVVIEGEVIEGEVIEGGSY